jgi:membrane fusion protein (multidrug efflux system)
MTARSRPPAAQAGAPVMVEVQPVRLQAMADEAGAVGSLVASAAVVLRPEVAGRIAAIHFREGAVVRKGALLLELDAAVQRAELQQAQAALNLAEANARRSEELFARRFVSQGALDGARSQLESARAALALAQARLDRTRIRAPFDGVLGLREVSPGDYVKEGEALVGIADIALLKVDFRLPERYLARVRIGQTLEVGSEVLPGERYTATVDAIDPQLDAQGRSLLLRARLPNPQGRLRPGGFVQVRLILDPRPEALVVAEEALVPAPGNQLFVYRVVDQRAQRVEVKTGVRREAQVEILQGLAPGDLVVTAGQLKLRDGAAVQLAAPAAATAR